jgi:hypothetical protein
MRCCFQALVFALGFALTGSGCYAVSVDYSPVNDLAALADAPAVQLAIVDARPEDQGLGDAVMIGQYRGSFGIPSQVENGKPGVMQESVYAVTIDALAGAGIAVSGDASIVLEATVLQFWADGMVGFGSWVEVQYRVLDAGWQQTIEGSGSGNGLFGDPIRTVEKTVERALVDLATQAGSAFAEDAFQTAVRE